MNDFEIIKMKFGNEFWLILFREYKSPKLFAARQVERAGVQHLFKPLFGGKTVYNYGHCCTTMGVGGGGVIFSSPLQGVRQTISRGPGGRRQIEECQMKKYSKTILSLCTA